MNKWLQKNGKRGRLLCSMSLGRTLSGGALRLSFDHFWLGFAFGMVLWQTAMVRALEKKNGWRDVG